MQHHDEATTIACDIVREVGAWLVETPQERCQAACSCALAATYAYLATNDTQWLGLVRNALDIALRVRSRSVGLHGGVLEIGWTLSHVENLDVLELSSGDRSFLRALDKFVRDLVIQEEVRYELVNGLVGFGAYASERGPSRMGFDLLAEIVRSIERRMVRTELGGYLLDPTSGDPTWVDFGLAHGQSGLLPLLAAATMQDAESNVARATLEHILSFMSAVALDGPDGVLDGKWIDTGKAVPSSRSRGWCYGALGMGAAFHSAGRICQRADLVARGLSLAADAAADASMLVEHHVCHGHAGAAILFARFGSPELDRAGQRELALSRAVQGDRTAFAGAARERTERSADLLTGACGVALAHIALGSRRCGWQSILGLPFPSATAPAQ